MSINRLRPLLIAEAELNRNFRSLVLEFDCEDCRGRKATFISTGEFKLLCILCRAKFECIPIETLLVSYTTYSASSSCKEEGQHFLVPSSKDQQIEQQFSRISAEINGLCNSIISCVQILRQDTVTELQQNYWKIREPHFHKLAKINEFKAQAIRSSQWEQRAAAVRGAARTLLHEKLHFPKLVPESDHEKILRQVRECLHPVETESVILQSKAGSEQKSLMKKDDSISVEEDGLANGYMTWELVLAGRWWSHCLPRLKGLATAVQLHLCSQCPSHQRKVQKLPASRNRDQTVKR